MSRLVPTLLLTALLAGTAADCRLRGAETTGDSVRLMGYEKLDAQGRPQGIVVAVPRARFDELWARSHGKSGPDAPPVALALGAPQITLTLAGGAGPSAGSVEGRLELPLAVPGSGWQELRLPLPGAVRELSLQPLAGGAVAAKRLTWKTDGGSLVLNLEGGQQALLVLTFTLTTSEAADGRRTALALAPGLGGRLRLSAPAPWRAVADGLLFSPEAVVGNAAGGRDTSAADLPTTGGSLTLGWTLPADAVPVDGRLAVEQQVAVRLEPGRIGWTADLTLTSAGTPLATARLVPPPGLVLADIAGDGVAGWRRDGAAVVVTFAEPAASRALRLVGVLPRDGGGGHAAVLLTVPGAAVSRGRLGFTAGEGERFLRPEDPHLANAQPAEGEALATRWDDLPEDLQIAWEATARELTISRDLALVVGEGRARALVALTVAGRGTSENLRLALPAPWRVAAVDGATAWAVAGEGTERELVLSGAQPWADGATIAVRLEAERTALGAEPPLPLLVPRGSGGISGGNGISAGRLRLAVADAGATRARLDAGDARPLAPEQLAQDLTRAGGLPLAAGEHWRAAAELTGDAQPTLRLGSDTARATATLSHYLILGRDGVRWSLHLATAPDQGALDGLTLRLPAGARLVTVSGVGLGRWTLSDGRLHLALAAPTVTAVAIDLELDLPAAADGTTGISAPLVEDLRCEQQIALVEDDDLGLVHRQPDGLGDLEQPIARLPDGVARAQVRWLWKAARPDWSLRLSREPLAATTGADGLATLVDGAVAITPDGELRGTATWHVVNRTRQQLPLELAEGVELWEARVDGQGVRVRQDASGARWLPVPPLRPGQATSRISLVWRAAAAPGARLHLRPPVLGQLKVIASVWRITAPVGWKGVARTGGSLLEADPTDAAADRAQVVIDEIQRLQSVDGLNEAGLKRLEGQLAVLDSELKDHLANLGRDQGSLHGVAAAAGAWSSKLSSTTEAITANSAQLGQLQQRITENYGNRANRRRQLSLDTLNQNWNRKAAAVEPLAPDATPPWRGALAEPRRLLPLASPWDQALAPVAGTGLGAGQAPPGLTAATGTTLTGIDLVGEPEDVALVLRGQGGALDAELELVPYRGPLLPWALLAAAGAALVGGCLLALRRPR